MAKSPSTTWVIEPFDRPKHDRAGFDCGIPLLNDWLTAKVSQFDKKDLARMYVLVETGSALNKTSTKATILHAEYHRPVVQPIGERFSRHYSDLAELWKQPVGTAALARLDLLGQVALFKSRFFSSSWANYGNAKPGTLRLAPASHREAELRQDYLKMEPMFLVPPAEFQEVLEALRDAESSINVLR